MWRFLEIEKSILEADERRGGGGPGTGKRPPSKQRLEVVEIENNTKVVKRSSSIRKLRKALRRVRATFWRMKFPLLSCDSGKLLHP